MPEGVIQGPEGEFVFPSTNNRFLKSPITSWILLVICFASEKPEPTEALLTTGTLLAGSNKQE